MSYDTVQDDTIGKTMTIEYEWNGGWFPIIKKADGFSVEPEEILGLAQFIVDLANHNDKVSEGHR
jgi:hypothetical protein